jgi:hypothetical protein
LGVVLVSLIVFNPEAISLPVQCKSTDAQIVIIVLIAVTSYPASGKGKNQLPTAGDMLTLST